MTCTMYEKRTGTSGIRGQLYETKLLSLINFRAIHDASIEEFYLATNVDNIGAFDDICFKAKIKGFDRPVMVFIQAKHRDNEKQKLDTKNDLAKYFDSYLKIRYTFKPNNKDVFFEGNFDETDCLFVMYTSAKDSCSSDLVLVESNLANKLNDLIGTGGAAKQFNKNQEHVEFLCKTVIKEQMITLAETMAKLIFDKCNLQMLLTDELVLRYHVILAQEVINVSEIQSGGYRNAWFRQDFFDTNEEFLLLLKDTLYKLVLKQRKIEHIEMEKMLSEFFNEPSDIAILSKLIGSVIDYKDGQFEFVNKKTTDSLKRKLSQVYVAPSTVNAAVELAAKEILTSREFKVPAAFGNRDITVQGDDTKIGNRLDYLTLKIYELTNKSDSNNIVTIDDSLGTGLLQMNGGIASAVGNILVSDENTKLMKFTDNNRESLEDLARRLFEKLKDKIDNLHKYRFEVKVKKFPKLSFAASEHEENLARDFLNKLLFYTNQADESGVEEIVKSDIEDDQRNNINNFQVQTDAIFLKYHDEIQKWWMKPKQAPYILKENKIYENAKKNILKEPLICVLNAMYNHKINKHYFTFNDDAVKSLELQDHLSRTVIVAESVVLTVLKVVQYLDRKNYVILDLEYILNLPKDDRNALYTELKNTGEEKIMIFIFDNLQHCRNRRKTLEGIAKAVYNKNTIMITDKPSAVTIKDYFTEADNVVHDGRNNLIDMSDCSQKSILKNGRMIFQGKEVSLDLMVDEDTMPLVHGDIFNRIISKDIIDVGKSVGNSNYDEMKHLYVDRRVMKSGDDDGTGKMIETFYDIEDGVVLITALPGMGKSTLLTHLTLKTKEVDPKVWIVRINLLEYSSVFGKWRENKTVIGSLEAVNFMCRVILNEKLGEEEKVLISLEESDGVVYLKECTGNQWAVFELKMFLHYYNSQKLIFVFDGFDEICPHYADDVIKCINIVKKHPRRHIIWIASRGYSEIKSTLEREFGTSYEIEPLSYNERQKYLEKFWRYNLILEELDAAQLDNVHNFLEFMSKSLKSTHNRELNLVEIYINAAVYFRNEIKSSYIPLWKYNKNTYDTILSQDMYDNVLRRYYRGNSNGIPLHLYLRADYFLNEVIHVNKTIERWNLDINTHTMYERYIDMKLKKIRFQDKNKMDIYNPDIMITYDKERADFIMKHKKLGAYAIFHQHKHALFDGKELKEIENTIQSLKMGGEKTGLICSTANDMPIFIHMSFAEYFAAEYVCDALKDENCNEKHQDNFNVAFLLYLIFDSYGVLEHVNYKMKIDEELVSVLKTNEKSIFDVLMKDGKVHSEYITNWTPQTEMRNTCRWWLTTAVTELLHNFTNIFLSIIESNLNEHNLNDFIDIVKGSRVLRDALCNDNFELISSVINIVRKFDESKFWSVVCDNFNIVPRDTNREVISTEEIIRHIKRISSAPALGGQGGRPWHPWHPVLRGA